MKDYKIPVRNGNIHFMYGDSSYITVFDEKRVHDFLELAEPLQLTEGEVASFMEGYEPNGKTTQDTELVLMKLMCLCGYVNTKVVTTSSPVLHKAC